MKQYLEKIARISAAAVVAVSLFVLVAPDSVHAGKHTVKDQLCAGVNIGTQTGCGTNAGGRLDTVLREVVNIFTFIVGIAAVIMIIVSGLKYITSSGDASNVNGAKNTLLYAIIGLVVVALAQFIVRFVIGRVT
jgi:cytochrome bd-type quinol oxidase subunit 2